MNEKAMNHEDHQNDWTKSDDDFLRGRLGTLRDDLDPHALPEPAFVRARGTRQRRTGRGWTIAGAAAAAAVAAAVIWNPLGVGDGGTQPGGSGTTVAQTTSPSTPATQYVFLDEPGVLPLAKEWTIILGEPVTAMHVTEGGPECGGPGGKAAVAKSLTGGTSGVQGGQYAWLFDDAAAAEAGFAKVIAGLEDCSPMPITTTRQADPSGSNPLGWPRIYRYTAQGEAGGWFIATHVGAFVSVIQVNPTSGKPLTTTLEQARMLGTTAQLRLENASSSGTTSEPTGTSTTLSANTDLKIRTVGDAKVPAREFISLEDWNAGATAKVKLVSEIPQEQSGTGIVVCDPAGDMGSAAINYLRAGSGNWVGYQRIQTSNIASDGSTNQGEPAAMVEAFVAKRSCPAGGDPKVTVTRGPGAGTVKIVTEYAGGAGPTTALVGITTLMTPNHTTTIVLDHVTDEGAAWADLERLMRLAEER